MLLYLLFDSLLSTCPKKMEAEKWPKAAEFLKYHRYEKNKFRRVFSFCVIFFNY